MLRVDSNSHNHSWPRLTWDLGTAYDLFVSLAVLHFPDDYDLRASWAAGVRSRLSTAERKLLEEVIHFMWIPSSWIYTLPEPKDAATALWALRSMPPLERLSALFCFMNGKGNSTGCSVILQEIAHRGAWSEADLEALKACFGKHKLAKLAKELPPFLDLWAKPAEFADLLLSALNSYYQAFFVEEEKQILPVLKGGLAHAQQQAQNLSLPDLLVELSQGVHFDEMLEAEELVLVPVYWSTPLILMSELGDGRPMFMFGVRPAHKSLVPGEMVPDALLRSLKSLADPTRLRILYYLSRSSQTPAELSRRLRLRAPTVVHHLKTLRLAGMVHVSLETGGEKRYAARLEALDSTLENLKAFLSDESNEIE